MDIFTYLNVSYKNSKLYQSRSISFTPTRLHFVHLSFPHRRKDTVARYKSINIAVYDSIPFSVSTRLIVFWIVAIFLFISPAQIHIYIYRFRFRSQRASNNTEERWCQAFATAYHGQSRKLECATRMRVPPSTCYGEECAIILELGYRWDIRTLCF